MLVRSVDHVLIDFIRYNKSVIFYGNLSDLGQLFSCEDFSARVGRVADDDCFRTCLKAFFHQINVKGIGRRHKRDVDWLGSG